MPLINDHALGSSSSKINGVLGNYDIVEGNTFNKGDFVGIKTSTTEKASLYTLTSDIGIAANRVNGSQDIKIIRLNNSNIILSFYTRKSTDSIYCRITEVNTTTNLISGTNIYSFGKGCFPLDAIAIDDNNILVIYNRISANKYCLLASIINIDSGGNITNSASDVQLIEVTSKHDSDGFSLSLTSLETNKFLLTYYGQDSTMNLNSCILTVSADYSTITVGTPLTCYTNSDTLNSVLYSNIKSIKIDDTHILVLTKITSIYAVLLEIQNDDTISTLALDTNILITDLIERSKLDAVLLTNNKVFIAYAVPSSTTNYLDIKCAILEIDMNNLKISILNSIKCDIMLSYNSSKSDISISCCAIDDYNMCLSVNIASTMIASYIIQLDANNLLLTKDAINYYGDNSNDYNTDPLDSLIMDNNKLLLVHLYEGKWEEDNSDGSTSTYTDYTLKYQLYQLEKKSPPMIISHIYNILGVIASTNKSNANAWFPAITYEKYNTVKSTGLLHSKFPAKITAIGGGSNYVYTKMEVSGNSIILSSSVHITNTIQGTIYYSTYPSMSSKKDTVTCTTALKITSIDISAYTYTLKGSLLEISDNVIMRGTYIGDESKPLPALYEYPTDGVHTDRYWYVLKDNIE